MNLLETTSAQKRGCFRKYKFTLECAVCLIFTFSKSQPIKANEKKNKESNFSALFYHYKDQRKQKSYSYRHPQQMTDVI